MLASPGVPYRRFTLRVSGEGVAFSTAALPSVEPWPVCLKTQGWSVVRGQ